MMVRLAPATDGRKPLVGQRVTVVAAAPTLVERLGRGPTFEVVILSGNNTGK